MMVRFVPGAGKPAHLTPRRKAAKTTKETLCAFAPWREVCNVPDAVGLEQLG